jgi:hypothetical protein
MKKTLITIALAIIMSVGVFISADIVSAEEASVMPLGYSVVKRTDDQLEFVVSMENLDTAIIEYSFFSNEVLMSSLIEVDLSPEGCVIGTDENIYIMDLPEEALSVIVWRVTTSDDEIKSLSGTFEYTESPETAISAVETRVKQIYVENKLVTREQNAVVSGVGLVSGYTFRMHFDLNDENGESIPIDYIYSVSVEYDVVTSYIWGLIPGFTSHESFELVSGETRNMDGWPFLRPFTVYESIEESFDEGYNWLITLGSYASDKLNTKIVQIDNVELLTISYFYEGVFYDREEVQDGPYDSDDVIDVIPGTIDPVTSLLDQITTMFESLSSTVRIILAVLGLILLILAFIFVKGLVNVFIGIGKAVIWVFKALGKIIRFIVYVIPKTLMTGIIFLFIPQSKRKERNRNASRYI